MKNIPVYIFTGLLESGKTSFIREIMADPNFTENEKTLILALEEGIEEYDSDFLNTYNCTLASFDSMEDANPSALTVLQAERKPDRVMIELNGMWNIDEFMHDCLPENWEVYQIVAVINGNTFELYSANLGPRMFEHITRADLIVFNRCTEEDKDYLHSKNIRAMNPKATIFLDDVNGNSEDYMDNLELSFDPDDEEINLSDEDFGLWYIDASSDPNRYDGKIITVRALALTTPQLPDNWAVAGRFGMVCCADDITFIGFACDGSKFDGELTNKTWYNLTAKIRIEELSQYRGEGPVLEIMSAQPTEPPKEELVYFN